MRYNIPLYEIQTREEEAAMRKLLVLLLALLLALSAAACGKEEELEPWTMPEVDTKPTPVRTPVPTFGGGNPESFVWNEVEFLNMALPGADPASRQEKHTHKQALALFPYNFLPASIFGESYAKYEKLTLKKTEHEVMLDEAGQLAEHAYVEFVYLPKSGKADEGLYVQAELCSYDAAREIYGGAYPHLVLPEETRLQRSVYYLREFALLRVGQQRAAQFMRLTPASYFNDARAAMSAAEENGETYIPARQVFLTVTCGVQMSDEAFTAAVCDLLTFSDGSEIVTPEPSRLPVFGEKGAA